MSGKSWNIVERLCGFPYPLWSPGSLLRLWRDVRTADAVHLHDCLYLPCVAAWAAAVLARRPVLITQHVGSIPFRNPIMRALLSVANRLLGKLMLGGPPRTVFVSSVVQRYFERFVAFRKPALRIPNGVDTDLFHPVEESVRRQLRVRIASGGEGPLLLFVGRFVEKKGLHLLQRLAHDLPQARWIFAGWGPLDPSGWGLPNVVVRRNLAREELVPLYQAADLLVLPSVGEGFPLVAQEAMACGTPALVGEQTAAGCPEAAGLLHAEPVGAGDDAARWRARIESVLAAPAALSASRSRVATFAREHWSWNDCVERYVALLRECVIEKQISSRLGKHSAARPRR